MSRALEVTHGKLPDVDADSSAAQCAAARMSSALRFVYAANVGAGVSGQLFVGGEDANESAFEATVDPAAIDKAAREMAAAEHASVWHAHPDYLYGLFSWSLQLHENDAKRKYDGRRDADKIVKHLNRIGFLARVDRDGDRYSVSVYGATAEPFTEDDEEEGGLWHPLKALMQFGEIVWQSGWIGCIPVSELAAVIGDEDPAGLAARIAIPSDRIRKLANQWDMVGRSIDLFRHMGVHSSDGRQDERVEFCVDGLVPRGCIALLAGSQEVGKSTLAHELIIAVGDGPERTWLGQAVTGSGLAVYLAGEDSAGSIAERAQALDPDGAAAPRVVSFPSDSRDISDILMGLEKVPELALVVVDPARKYIAGDEDSSENVNRFFTALEDIAKAKNCAVIVVHHLGKNAKPQNLAAVRTAIRGSGVFTDRPRVILGMFRRGDRTVIGLCKNNLPLSCGMVTEARTFIREASTLRHVLAEGAGRVSSTSATRSDKVEQPDSSLIDRALDAMCALLEEGSRLSPTGKYELWNWKHEALAGVSRVKVREAVKALVDKGLFVSDGGRIVAAE